MSVAATAGKIWRTPEIRNSVLFIIAMLVIFRVLAHIPIPGIDVESLQRFFRSNQILGLLNVFSGGTIENFSVVALGVAPYVTASIILQLLTMVIPKLEELSKEGESGQQKINQYTRYLTVPLAFIQSFSIITLLKQSGQGIIGNLGLFDTVMIVATLTAGSVFLMWIGEIISERKMGNGISLLIFAGIVASFPSFLQQALVSFDRDQLPNWILFGGMALITVLGVVVITEGQRNIPVSYARAIRGGRAIGGVQTHLPLRVNMAGVIPIIFAVAIVLFPPLVAQFLVQAKSLTLARVAQGVIDLFQNQLFYGIFYFALVVGFTYFYTYVVFKPEQISENLQKQGAFVPGIRPGRPTSDFLSTVVGRILLAGALFLGIIAVLPLGAQQITGSQNLIIGGTSLLIVVSVVIETVRQIQSQLTMREYEI